MCLPQCESKLELCGKCLFGLSNPDKATVVQCNNCGTVLGVYSRRNKIEQLPCILYCKGCRECSGIEFEKQYLNLGERKIE